MNSNEDMIKMQQDAIKRVREMHARAKMSMEGKNQQNKTANHEFTNTPQTGSSPIKNAIIPATRCHNQKHHKNKAINPLKIFDALLKDEEKTLILILLILLAGEEDNIGIVLTLVYLLI